MGTLRVEAGNPAPSASGPGGQTKRFRLHLLDHGQSGATPISGVEEGADAILKLALSPELEGKSGLYFNGQRKARADAQAYDAVARQKLRANTIKLARLPTRERASS
jgi:hypothetical protein